MSDQLMGELNLIKRWEIHFQRKEATCVDKMALGGEDAAVAVAVAATRKLCRNPWCAHEPASPSTASNKQQTAANRSTLAREAEIVQWGYRSWRQQLIGRSREAAGSRPALRITSAPITVWCEVTNASVCITAISPVLQPG